MKASTSFKLEQRLIDRLEALTVKDNRARNNFVETALVAVVLQLEADPSLTLGKILSKIPGSDNAMKEIFGEEEVKKD